MSSDKLQLRVRIWHRTNHLDALLKQTQVLYVQLLPKLSGHLEYQKILLLL